MDAAGFDRITQSLARARTRRAFTASALAMALATLTLGGSGQHLDVEARKKRKKRKKRRKRKQRQTQTPAELQFNEFGCIDVGAPCRGNSDFCCSGICEGPAPNPGEQDTSRCVAHHVATCLVGQSACDAAGVDCGVEGFCYTTTGKAGFCGAKANLCRDCKKDKDCEEEFGAGAACLSCLDCGIGGTACAAAAV